MGNVAREPRFQLKEGDAQVLHYMRANTPEPVKAVEVQNVSDGGAAFTIQPMDVPQVGEIIQIDLQILEHQPSMKRRARVLRVERSRTNELLTKLAVQFIVDADYQAGGGVVRQNNRSLWLICGLIFAIVVVGLIFITR